MGFCWKEFLYVCVIIIENIEVGWTLTFNSPSLPLRWFYLTALTAFFFE